MPSFARALAETHPEQIALRDEVKTMSWHDVDDALNRVANGINTYDLGDHRRVAVFAENACETAMANLGGLVAGASVVPVNFHLTAEEVAYILEDSDARVLFADGNTIERALEAAALAKVAHVIAWDTEVVGDYSAWDDWIAAQDGAAALKLLAELVPEWRRGDN